MSEVFNPQRMHIARARRMLNVRQLAHRIGVRPLTIASWTDYRSEPTAAQVTALALTLDWPEEFFYGDDLDVPETVSFRNQPNP